MCTVVCSIYKAALGIFLLFSMKFWLCVKIVEVEEATYFNKQKREWLTFF